MTTREVVLDGGSPWGFRLHGGADVNQPLRISRVNPGSKAALRGVREGDFITSINGQSTKDVSNTEAHALLKNSGDTLKLGLNEDCSGSPKRRQFKTVHQETHSETVKRSSTTSYSLTSSKIISQTGDINDTVSSTKVNGTNQHTSVTNGDRNVPASQRSTLSSTSSSSPPSTYTETGTAPQHPIEDLLAMSDNVTSSRSRRRRSRNQRKKAAKNAAVTIETTDQVSQEPKTLEYRVESPPKLNEAKKKSPAPGPVKSKSLDDDEMVKIQELSETSETEDKPQSTAIITEVESDPDLIDDQPMISPEEELTLRNFLESLNLSSAPPHETVPAEKSENPKARKAQNRAAIEQYFMPIAQNPRFLDVISEETSDLSDREQIPKHHPTPELEIPKNSPRAKRRRRFKQPVDNPAMLLDTKIVEVPTLSHATVTCATPSEAEIVFLSDSESPEESLHDVTQEIRETDKEHHESEADIENHESETNKENHESKLTEEKHQSELTGKSNATEEEHENVPEEKFLTNMSEESDVTEERHEIVFNVKKNGVVVEEGKRIETSFEVLTPPPTPDSASPKNETSTRVMYDPKKSEVLEDNIFGGIPREIFVMCTSGYASEDLKDDYSKSKDYNNINDRTKWFEDFFKQDSNAFKSFEKTTEKRFEESSFKKVVYTTDESATEKNEKTEVSSHYESDSQKKRFKEKTRKSAVDGPKNASFKTDDLKINDSFKSEEVENSDVSSNITEVIATSRKRFFEQRNEEVETCMLEKDEKVANKKIDFNQNERLDDSNTSKDKSEAQEKSKGRQDENGSYMNSFETLNTNLNKKLDYEGDKSKNYARMSEENCNDLIGTSDACDEEAQKDIDESEELTNLLNIVIHSEIKEDQQDVVQKKCKNGNGWLKNDCECSDSVLKNQESLGRSGSDVRISEENLKNSTRNSDEETQKNIDESEELTDVLQIVVDSEIKEEDEVHKAGEDIEEKSHLNLPRLLPSPTPSVSSEGSSSRASSMSTARYIPMNSSIGDVTSLTVLENPSSLRELCLNYLLSLPFGADVIQELADVALSIQALTDNLTDKAFTKDFLPDMPSAAKWIGVPTERDPRLLMCLSPTQKDQLEKTRRIDCEADKLLDLHEKFIFREQAGKPRPQVDGGNVEIKFPACGNDNSNESRLLAIIRDEPQQANKQEDFLYYVAKGGREMSATLPSTARLRAKDLNEWLQLARSDEAANKPVSRPGNRRQSLPQELYAKQMEYLLAKEREIQKELENLEEEKRKLIEGSPVRQFRPDDYHISRKGDYAETKNRPVSMPAVPSEFFRQAMYNEYMDKVMQREERKQLKVIKVTTPQGNYEKRHSIGIEDEFMDKVKEKHKLGKLDLDVEEQLKQSKDEYEISEPVLVMDGDSLKGTRNLPKHLQEFIDMAKLDENSAPEEEYGGGVWSPGQKQESFKFQEPKTSQEQKDNTSNNKDEPISPVWTPKSATSSPTTERKEFRPVKFESPVLGRKNYERVPENTSKEAPWKTPETSSETGIVLSSTLQKRLPTSHSSPASGFNDYTAPRLPRAQNPTITLLQKAREGQLPKAGALYIEPEQSYNKRLQHERPASVGHGEILYKIKNEYTSESDSERPPRRMTDLGPSRKVEGVGPTTRDRMPLILRSEVKDANQSKWYKKMYDTIHKQKPHRDEYVTVRYKQRRGQYPYASGYLSEPEPGAYDSDYAEYKYATLDRRRLPIRDKENTMSSTMPRNFDNKFTAPVPDEVVKHGHDAFKNQPGRIENYIPGHSSISEKEAKEWWDEVMDIFDGHLEQQKRVPQPKSFINQALKESGYESDSTLVFRRRDDVTAQQQLSPLEQKEAYKVIQAGGDIPLHGLRKPAPERPKDDPELEFFPISPTLTRIRIHKNIKPQTEILCYPVTVHYPTKRSTTPNIPKPPPLPPSPPRRRSSRNNSTLRLVSTMKVKSTEKLPVCKRHETCFTTTSDIDNTNVKYLRDKLTYKLSPTMKSKDPKNTKPKVKVTTRTSPEIRSKVVVEAAPKASPQKCNCCTRIHSTLSLKRPCKCKIAPTKPETKTFRTFGTEKRKFDLAPIPKVEKRCILVNSPELLSPNEVKKAQGTVYKKSTAVLASAKNSASTALRDISIPIKVGFTEKGKTILKSTVKKKRSPPQSFVESLLQSPTTKKKVISTVALARNTTPKVISRTKSSSSLDSKKLKKSKKEQINGEIAKKVVPKELALAKSKCSGKASGAEIAKKLREMEDFGSNSTLADIQNQRDLIQSDQFFQHLFLRDVVSPDPSIRNSWLLERAYQLQRQSKPSVSEPSINAMKVYLEHTRPVSESKFRSLEFPRSRSVSPKSVTFERASQRSSSLPPKLVFSQTSRPVSPKIERKYKPPTPPLSPRVIRSPSSRRIMYLRHNAQPVESVHRADSPSPRGSRLDLFCPSLSRSNSSLDSYYDRKEYQAYVRELLHSSKRSSKFRDLNDFYATIEKFGQLEQTASSLSLKPRGRFEEEIIDYDRWKEVRARERAERELKSLVLQLKEDQKEKGFLFRSKDVDSHKWRREFDRGLRVKEKSVENIKEEFEKIEKEESEKIAKREFLDTYKPLWRGTSVLNLGKRMVERRSQSEGRVASARQKLIDSERMLTHGIGSRLWSSLSMEQVNILKKQLSEIYTNDNIPKIKDEETSEYAIQVPNGNAYKPALTVRRNSDSSEYSYRMDKGMSESDKKMLSQTLSREVLDHISKRKDTALPLVLAKETRGAVAAADANIKAMLAKPTREEPKKALVKTNALNVKPVSETESASTDESSKTVIYRGVRDDIKKKVEYFEHSQESDYCPTVYKPAENHYSNDPNDQAWKRKPITSHSYQDLKELFGERELAKFATIPLSATRKPEYVSPERPQLRALRLPSPPISEANSYDSFYRSRSLSPFYWDEPLALVKAGEVRRLKSKFEYDSGTYPPRILFRPRRWRSDPNLNKDNQICVPGQSSGDVELLRSKYEYPAHAGRGRSRLRRGGVVSPTFFRAEDRFMPHINIISKMANLYGRKSPSTGEKSTSTEDLARILGCPVGEVEKLRQKFDNFGKNISLLGHMFTSSPNIKELRDIAPYLTASWIAHRYPKSEDNTRSLSSPDYSAGCRDTSLVRKDRPRPKSTSPPRKSSILRTTERKKFDPKVQPLYRYQPEPVRYNWTPTHSVRPSVSFQEPEPPVPPPKGQHGVRSQEPESPRKYVENEVTIHYKTPVRQEIKEYLSEDELAYRQAEAMKKIYQEERRRKYLQELQDMNNRRHTDNFIPSQKSPIPLNRYDDFEELTPAPPSKPKPRSPEPRLLARALYNFVGQTARELTFRKGDLIYVRRQVDKNWYEGELNAMVGLFPVNYVEIVTYDTAKSTPRKSYEGQARAKFNFVAQTHLELSLAKGELVVVTRRVDDNWFEGKIGGRKGIFPVSYVDLLIDPSDPPPPSSKPVASPAAHSLLLNGSAGGKDSMGSHSYLPNISSQITTSYHAKPVQVSTSSTGAGSNYGSLNRSSRNPVSEALHIETQSEPIPYRALYKYLPQNDDELELLEGDTVYVLEKCDDGWYVGSSERTGAFGTFPGNYVEKI